MERTSVTSKNLVSVGYDEGDMVLEAEFTSGAVYQYAGVPPEVYDGLMKSESRGRFFRKEVAQTYAYKRVQEPRA